MRTDHTNAPMRFVGFDSGGEVFQCQGRILRGIYPGKGALYRKVLSICESHDLFQFGIVATRELTSNPYPELSYDLVLEHEKIPFISYPHEWSASMLKDAAIFHIDLYTELGKQGLSIKDWHPYNILFKGTIPIFVDFSSIIPIGNLQDEAYLTPPRVPLAFKLLWDKGSAYFFEMYRRMCDPYFLFPLYMMHKGQYTRAHIRMFEATMNAANSLIRQDEVYASGFSARMRYKLIDILKKLALIQQGPVKRRYLQIIRSEIDALSVSMKASVYRNYYNILKKLALIQRGPVKRRFLQLLRVEIDRLSVSLQSSDYSNYYTAKGEEFGFTPSPDWTNKQRVVDEAIKRYQPQTLLDIGSNTGWFSILATKLGCQVVALDIDDACVDGLYQRAKRENLPILPLVANLINLTPDVAPNTFEKEPSLSLIGGESPLLMSADKRLKCDMVLALAIVHHLALGSGLNFEQIIKLLGSLTVKYLLVEFIAKDDKLIVAEPTFFPSYSKNPQKFSWYTLENFLLQLKSVFRSIDVKLSNSDSRFIIICTK